jgi:SNF2 family DNA or RNA helicase
MAEAELPKRASVNRRSRSRKCAPSMPAPPLFNLHVTFNQIDGFAQFIWSQAYSDEEAVRGVVTCAGANELSWEIRMDGQTRSEHTTSKPSSIDQKLGAWIRLFPTRLDTFRGSWILRDTKSGRPTQMEESPFGPDESPYAWMAKNLKSMADALSVNFTPLGRILNAIPSDELLDAESYHRKSVPKKEKALIEEARRAETMAKLAEERRQRELRKRTAARATIENKAAKTSVGILPPPATATTPPVPLRFESERFEVQDTVFPVENLQTFFLRERASQLWVSNQSDDLLCLPYCRIEKLEYQVRAALRVLGALRGRALLSDEVGLGKTIEAGLIIKELLTRGMISNFLVLTVPSLVDQWHEELEEKFGLTTATTNQPGSRADPQDFWQNHSGIVSSLHTFKQPAQLEIARQKTWDMLVVDEAHYLRNRDSQAWQAVNSVPRQFLLLLTATPVQNSLEELYNLVTLLQPGQLPSPREFRSRFIDPKRPRQPREPEELRRLLGQVMIRNTRANAGIKLPPRRAETVLFEPAPDEKAFWSKWEQEFRSALASLNPGQASLWGRLLLQTAGSSPAAWLGALKSFPDNALAGTWQEKAPLQESWSRKCLLIPPLCKSEGGAVVFTQFLETQAALARFLESANIPVFVVNGQTPAANRQAITEKFRRAGGALILTHSGTEGRNLQFCHRLVNFDLPWNPMEIEQRIGRLHRLGQERTVHIYNFVQTGSLQEMLLQILQEKLNLFELVVGETGLVLGERYSSGEFADEVLKRWRENEGQVAEAMSVLGNELAQARNSFDEVKQLDETLFAKDYELA